MVEAEAVDQFAPAADAFRVVVELDVVLEVIEERGGQRHVAVFGEGGADAADVAVDPEDLLHHHQRTARRDVRLGAPCTDSAVGGLQ